MVEPPNQRPDPDELLQRLQQQEAQSLRGKLRIYFGASAGVGKTYAMLSAAQRERQAGRDVLVGVIETHGRSETAGLLTGLAQLPLRELAYRGRTLREFDLDAALHAGASRQPLLLLVDELAHTNVEGSRHPKRWQDVQELLEAGIDVWSTLNVQHLESLHGTVGAITGIRVHETVPDTVLDGADEIILVDVTPDELLARLKAGKVYLPQQAQRVAQSIAPVWNTEGSILVCIGPHPGAEQAVRSAARLAGQLGVRWHAAYVETPALQRQGAAERDRILAVLKLAQELGAETAVLAGSDAAAELVQQAQTLNCATLVVGRPRVPAWQARWRLGPPTMTRRLATLAPALDIVEVAQADSARRLARAVHRTHDEEEAAPWREAWPRYAWALATCLLTTALTLPLLRLLDLANIVMLFLLGVVLVAVRWGRGPAALAAFLNVAAFDFFFVPPRFSMAISDAQYLVTFAVMLVVGLLTGQLTANLRFSARIAAGRERRAQALFELTRDLSGALLTRQVAELGAAAVQRTFGGQARVLVTDAADRLVVDGSAPGEVDASIADWAFHNEQPAGLATSTLPSHAWHYVPLKAPMRVRGVLALRPAQARWLLIPEQVQQLETLARQIAIALERVHYVDVAQEALVQMESERLRNALLSAISHDVRTPLTALIGLAESLQHSLSAAPSPRGPACLGRYGCADRNPGGSAAGGIRRGIDRACTRQPAGKCRQICAAADRDQGRRDAAGTGLERARPWPGAARRPQGARARVVREIHARRRGVGPAGGRPGAGDQQGGGGRAPRADRGRQCLGRWRRIHSHAAAPPTARTC